MAKLGSYFRPLFFLSLACYLPLIYAQTPLSEIEYYKNDDVTNQIPLLENRFRIDDRLEEVTLLFYRRSGTPPIILIRPDGSKLKINNLPKDEVQWYDDRTFDLIRMKAPMPGPWQAVGDILPNSKIMVISDVRIEVEPLPEIILEGETLKVLAKLYNSDKAIDDPMFDDVIDLDIDFYSTNNSNFDNFGATPIEIGSFRDDGYELDEHAKDGIFTAEFELNFAPGEWVPIFRVKMPMANRELKQKPIILQKTPISLSVETGSDELNPHQVTFTIDDTFVDPDSLIFQGRVTFPDRQADPFSIMEGSGTKRVEEVKYTEPGIHRINVSAFGKTKNGREFRLVVPEFTFNVERPDGPLISSLSEDGGAVINGADSVTESQSVALAEKQAAAKRLAEELAQAQLAMEQAAKEKEQFNLILVIVINLLVLGAAAAAFFIYKRKQAKIN